MHSPPRDRPSLANDIIFYRKQRTLQYSYIFEHSQLLVLSKADFKCKCWFSTYTIQELMNFRFPILNTYTFPQSSFIAQYKMSSA